MKKDNAMSWMKKLINGRKLKLIVMKKNGMMNWKNVKNKNEKIKIIKKIKFH